MRTTVSIDDQLLAEARDRARSRGLTLGEFIETSLRRQMAAVEDADERPVVPVFRGGTGPRPGIGLSSNRALHEALDDGTPLDLLR